MIAKKLVGLFSAVVLLPGLLNGCSDPVTCQCPDDGLSCTQEVCSGDNQCQHVTKHDFCAVERNDRTVCVANGEHRSPDVAEDCAVCDSVANPNGWTGKQTQCDDDAGNKCLIGAICQEDSLYCVSQNKKADNTPCQPDENDCTQDICKSGRCEHPLFPNEPFKACEDDEDKCTADRCVEGVCTHTPTDDPFWTTDFEGNLGDFKVVEDFSLGNANTVPAPRAGGEPGQAMYWGELPPPTAVFDAPPGERMRRVLITNAVELPPHDSYFTLEIYHSTGDYNNNSLDDVQAYLVEDRDDNGNCLGEYQVTNVSGSVSVIKPPADNPDGTKSVYDKCGTSPCPEYATWNTFDLLVTNGTFPEFKVCVVLLLDSGDPTSVPTENEGIYIDNVGLRCAQ